jgi:flagellar basal-body rod modification protein FlgD
MDMDLFGSSSITSAGSAAQAKIASAFAPMSAKPKASDSAAAGGSSTATITSNDFLVLLVSELKNQDPTKPTDPNEYIQQLVGVNSLQQLIEINKGLAAKDSSAAT